MDYIVEKRNTLTPLQKAFQRYVGQGSYSLVAHHLGCATVDVIKFAKGDDGALTTEQQTKLSALLTDLETGKWNGRPRREQTAFQKDEEGNTTWISNLRR